MRWLHLHLATLAGLLVTVIVLLVTHQPPKAVVILGAGHGTQEQSLVAATTSSTPANHLPPWWRERLLAVLGAPRVAENLRFLHAWQVAEGGTAQWNPLNTTYTLPYGESWSYNSSLVQNYFRPTAGVAATAITLIQPSYSCLLGAFQQAKLAAEQINSQCASQIRTWGTSPTVIARVLAS